MKDGGRSDFLLRLLRFIGSLGGNCHKLITEAAPEELQRPATSFSLRLPLAMGNAVVELELALFLAHLERATKGARRTSRLAAAEALHAIIRYVIGSDSVRATQGDGEAQTDFAETLRSPLLPLAIRLAADNDAATTQLFGALLTQLSRWTAHCPPMATLRALRDALLEAMSDPKSPNLRAVAAKHYAELLYHHEVKVNTGGDPAIPRKLLQYLLAAASHVDPSTQCGALQCLLWCALSWEGDTASPSAEAASSSLRVTVLCLCTSQNPGATKMAVQLGERLLRRPGGD